MRYPFHPAAALVIALVTSSACGGDGGGPNGDRTAPTVVSVVPAQGATGVARTTTVTATFSEPVAAATVTATTFGVKATGTNTPVAGSLAVTGPTVVFTPGAPLEFNRNYTITIGTGITDAAGNHLATVATSSFTTLLNSAPSANAGPAQDVNTGEAVQLTGSGTDPEGESLTFRWTQVAGPDVTAGAGFLTGQTPAFTAPATVSAVRFELRTTDASGMQSQGAIVQVNVMEDKTRAIFVSPTGNDANAGTSRDAPVKTLAMAISRAGALGGGADIYAVNGTYDESLSLASGTSVYGGYQSATWLRDAQQFQTTISGNTSMVAVTGSGISDIALDGLVIRTPLAFNATGQSMYGVRLYQSTNVRISNDVIIVGDAGPGSGGQFGASGKPALGGAPGAGGSCGGAVAGGMGGVGGPAGAGG
ncbi:MAG TPA: Ig-like domain-containing protein, partial [Gemmatimonadaceae bacterium]|nr:Ig-like domain-containing protein [Gemmatimonadaceae bacterium]